MGGIVDLKIVNFLIEELIQREKKEDSTYLLKDALIQQGEGALNSIHKKLRVLQQKLLPQAPIIESLLYCLSEIAHPKSIAPVSNLLRKGNGYFEENCIQVLAKISYKCKSKRATLTHANEDTSPFPPKLIQQIKQHLRRNIAYLKKLTQYEFSLSLLEDRKLRELIADAPATQFTILSQYSAQVFGDTA